MGGTASQPHSTGGADSQPRPISDLTTAINDFGNSLFDRVAAEAKPGAAGIFLSPYGIAQALAMVLNGVEPGGESDEQLRAAVYGGSPGNNSQSLDGLNSQLQELSVALVKVPSDDLTVSDANSAWLTQRYTLQPQYADALSRVFGTAPQPLTTAAAINAWVSEATRGKISEIVDEGAISQAVLVLVNAVYFKGTWRHQLKKRSTFAQDFHLLPHGATRRTATMFQVHKEATAVAVGNLTATVGGSSVECAAVQLPYRGGEFYAVAAMPRGDWSAKAADGGQRGLVTTAGTVPYMQALAACRKALLADLPAADDSGGGPAGGTWQLFPQKDVKLYLPRFEVQFSTSLSQALQGLGIRKPFDGGDITQIAADTQGGQPIGDLFVSDVLHKVYAKVDEEGTEAAAATAVIMMRCAMSHPREEIELRFDRPFVFAVVHRASRLALFCGEVHQPEAWHEE